MVSTMANSHVPRALLDRLTRAVAPGKVVVLYGPRQVGKTTLLRRYVREHDPEALFVSGEDPAVREQLEGQSIARLAAFVGGRRTLIVDEAQHLREVGLILKLFVDHLDGLRVIATGSSSFDLATATGEPLTGRKKTLLLLPLAQLELGALEGPHETSARLPTRLVYGSYPEVALLDSDEERALHLRELVSAYLFRDVLQVEGVRHSTRLLRLVQLVAHQIGAEVSLNELGTQLGLSKNTVDRYLDLLEKCFVLYSRGGFSRNRRKEISRSRRYYFYDNGIRNAVIANFNPISLRDDIGALWENYILTERMKRNLYTGHLADSYFWRTYDRQEVDLVEEWNGALHATETKWSPRRVKPPAGFRSAYPDATFRVVHRNDYLDFITPSPDIRD